MLLKDKWSDVNSADSKGWTPLMRAGKNGRVLVVNVYNADVVSSHQAWKRLGTAR